MRDDSDYSGSEDEERTREDTGGQQRHPGETRCEECAAGDVIHVIGALEKGEVDGWITGMVFAGMKGMRMRTVGGYT